MKKKLLIIILCLSNVFTLILLYTTHKESQKLKLEVIELTKKSEESQKMAERVMEESRQHAKLAERAIKKAQQQARLAQ